MTPLLLILLVALLACGTVFLYRRRQPVPVVPVRRRLPAPLAAAAFAAMESPTSQNVDEPLAWVTPQSPQAQAPAPSPQRAGELHGALRRRYIAARFPGISAAAADLAVDTEVIKAARLYFEDGKFARAQELLAMASEQAPALESLPLAQVELAFLARDAELFIQLARHYSIAFPDGAPWAQICRLGHALAPNEELFGLALPINIHSQYGPWPDTPNWIQASWDLTADVMAADFHQALVRENPQ